MMMAMMPVILQALTQGQAGMGGPSTYVPRMSMPSMYGQGGGGLFGTLAGGGQTGQTAAMVAAMLGQSFNIDLTPYQMSPFANTYLQREQLALQRAVGSFSLGAQGTDMVRALGMDPTQGFGKMLSGMSPMMMQMMPELRNLQLAMSPTAVFDAGRTLATTAQMMDPMGRFNQHRMDALGAAFDEFTVGEKDGRRYRRATNMAGFTRDDFATFVELGADLGLIDTDFTQEDRNRMRAAGKSQADIDAMERMRVGKNQAEIGRAIRNSIAPGASAGEIAMIQQQMGLTANSGTESHAITKLLNELEGLGRAAGMTAQEMMNAGRALQMHSGGSLLFNMEAAAQGKLVERTMRTGAAAEHRGLMGGIAELRGQEAAEATAEYGKAGYMRTMAGIMIAGDAADKEHLMDVLQRGDSDEIAEYLTGIQKATSGKARAMQAAGVNATDAQFSIVSGELAKQGRMRGFDLSRTFPGLAMREIEEMLGEDDPKLRAFKALNREEQNKMLLGYQSMDFDAALNGLSVGGDVKEVLRSGMSEDPYFQQYLSRAAQARGVGQSDEAVKEEGRRLSTSDMIGDALHEAHGAGLIKNLQTLLKTGNFAAAAASAGLAAPEELQQALEAMDKADREAYSKAETDAEDAQKILDSKDATPEQRKAAIEKLGKANKTLMAGDTQISNFLEQKYDPAAKGAAEVAKDQAAEAGKVGSASSTEKEPMAVQVMIKIMDENGQEIPSSKATATASITPDARFRQVHGVGPGGTK
jgi:hypothetical protein